MKLYIVRHGSTSDLENKHRQTNTSSLSQTGQMQAKKVADKLIGVKIDLFFSSPLTRTKETSDTISRSIKIKYSLDGRLSEIGYPAKFYGKAFSSQIIQKYDKQKSNRQTSLDWKFLNEGESIRDTIGRMASFKNEMVEDHISQNILIVSHAYAIRCLIASCISDNDGSDEVMIRVFRAISIDKASLSILEFLPANKHCRVRRLNDTSHLE